MNEKTEQQERARAMVARAVKSGVLVRPETCNRCGRVPPRTRDGRTGVQGHHHDYSKPLDVEWLCSKCHRTETPLPAVMGAPTYGERNGQSKLTVQAVREIRASPLGCRKLSAQYGVDKRVIQWIRMGKLWTTTV